MTRFLPHTRKRVSRGFVRLLAFTLIVALTLPLPAISEAATPSSSDHVLRRLNSQERKAAIEEARRMDEAARATFTDSDSSAPSVSSSAARPEPETRPDAVSRRTERPRTVTEVLFNGVAGFMGMPGLQGAAGSGAVAQRSGHGSKPGTAFPGAAPSARASVRQDGGPSGIYTDQGLGFHQDGTARRADGTTGNFAAGANFDGRRAASSMAHGLGYGPGSHGGHGMSDMNGWYGAGYDPVMGYNHRLGDPAMGARGGRGGMGSGGGMFDMTGMDPQRYFMQRGLNYGVGWLNSLGEAAFTGLFDKGRARLNFMADLDGRVGGEGDALYPFYDGQYTTVFTQVGARTMAGMSGGDDEHGRSADRWIGNFGLGQRWYPAATLGEDGKTVDSGNWMFGYNVFFDNDFTRSHQRGGVGLEAQWDWLKLAYNHYLPLSGWKGSYDFDSTFVEERPAQGWDVRVKGYLPFYRNVAVTGAYTQWYGDKVAMFSTSTLEKDPKVWSYGLEYTPVPMLSAFWNQRSTERGRNDTEFGLRFTWHFGMSWDDQTSHAKVADLRTVSASRHEFVDRENRIILEYRAKNAYRIEYLGPDGANGYLFRLQDGFGAYKAGQSVRVIAGGAWLAEAAPARTPGFFAQAVDLLDTLLAVKAAHAAGFTGRSYVTDRQGRFWIQLDASAPASATVTVTAGNTSRSFTLAGGGAEMPQIQVSILNATLLRVQFDSDSLTLCELRATNGPLLDLELSLSVPPGYTLSQNTLHFGDFHLSNDISS